MIIFKIYTGFGKCEKAFISLDKTFWRNTSNPPFEKMAQNIVTVPTLRQLCEGWGTYSATVRLCDSPSQGLYLSSTAKATSILIVTESWERAQSKRTADWSLGDSRNCVLKLTVLKALYKKRHYDMTIRVSRKTHFIF